MQSKIMKIKRLATHLLQVMESPVIAPEKNGVLPCNRMIYGIARFSELAFNFGTRKNYTFIPYRSIGGSSDSLRPS